MVIITVIMVIIMVIVELLDLSCTGNTARTCPNIWKIGVYNSPVISHLPKISQQGCTICPQQLSDQESLIILPAGVYKMFPTVSDSIPVTKFYLLLIYNWPGRMTNSTIRSAEAVKHVVKFRAKRELLGAEGPPARVAGVPPAGTSVRLA